MPIDTRNKRSSAIQPVIPWRGQYPAPDGALDQADRQHAALVYRGILAASPVPVIALVVIVADTEWEIDEDYRLSSRPPFTPLPEKPLGVQRTGLPFADPAGDDEWGW